MYNNTVDIQNLTYTYPDGREALHSVSLSVTSGQKVALVGANGAGKSTLFLHLNGLLPVQSGHVQACGMAVVKKNLGRVRAKVGLVFQDPNDQLFSPTVFDDVAFGPLYQGLPESEIRYRVEAALAAVGMSVAIDRAGYHLSLGEKKRVAIATVLAMDPEILVLDEPSAGLDPRARRQLIELLQSLQLTLLVATHDLALVETLCPRTVVMDAGYIVADGATTGILGDHSLLDHHGLA